MEIEKPNLNWNGNLRPLQIIDKLIQHHMAHNNWDFYDVHRYHRDQNGWMGIGYNYWISFSGKIYEGRGHHIGAHAGRDWNSRSLGIGYQGNFETQQMTNAQVEAGAWLNAKLIKKYGVDVNDIIGHENVGSTSCPGRNFRMEELRQKTEEDLTKGKGEDSDMIENAILVNQMVDMLNAEPHHQRLKAAVYTIDGFNEDVKIKNLIIAGGGERAKEELDFSNVENVEDYSGSDRWMTAENLGELWRNL